MHIYEHTVHLSDTDTTGQVYYARPLEWLEWCRVDWFTKQFGNFMKFVETSGITFFPSKVSVDYRKPVLFGDGLRIEMTATEVKKVSFTLSYTVKRGEETVLSAETVIVCFDTKKNSFGRLTPEMLTALQGMQA